MKCKIKMTDKIRPVDESSNGETGTCPECMTPGVLLSIVGGFIRAHTVSADVLPENNPQPATLTEAPVKYGKGLSEPQTDVADTGVRIGDPRAAEQRRVAEIEGASGTGTVKVPRKVQGTGTTKSNKPRMTTKMVEVEATEEHVREALDYWRGRRITERTSDAVRKQQVDMVSSLCRRLEGFRQARGDENPGKRSHLSAQVVDTAQAHRGPTLVRGRDTTPRQRDPELSWDEPTDLRQNGAVRMATTLDQPLGRERFDRKITDVPAPKRKRTASERRRYRRAQLAQGK